MAGGVEQRFGEDATDSPIEAPEPGRSDSILVCWRAEPTLTVSVLVLGISRASFGAAEVAAVIDEVWALQG